MTVKELISELEKIKNNDKEIVFRYMEYTLPEDSIGHYAYSDIGKVMVGSQFFQEENGKFILTVC